MGNRAIITTKEKNIGIYLHWNGGRESVEAFVAYCALKGYRAPDQDAPYAFARLAQVVGNFFGGGLSVGVLGAEDIAEMGGWLDNGIYLLDDWDIAGRVLPYEGYVEETVGNLTEHLRAIDRRQPKHEQLGALIDANVLSRLKPAQIDSHDGGH